MPKLSMFDGEVPDLELMGSTGAARRVVSMIESSKFAESNRRAASSPPKVFRPSQTSRAGMLSPFLCAICFR